MLNWPYAITALALVHPNQESKQQNTVTTTSARIFVDHHAEVDRLAIGDEAGMVSFWVLSRKDARVRFLGMPSYKAMQTHAVGTTAKNALIDEKSRRLLKQYGVDVTKALPETAERKGTQFKEHKPTPETKAKLSPLEGLFSLKPHYSNQQLLTQADTSTTPPTPLDQKHPSKLSSTHQQRLWSSPKPQPSITSSSASSSSSSSSSTFFSNTSSSQSASTLSATATINSIGDILILD
jgi:hypothetical protein